MPRRIVGRSRAVRVLLALTAISACLVAVAYAATRPEGRGAASAAARHAGKKKPGKKKPGKTAPGKKQRQTRPPRPRFIEFPTAPSIGAQAQFRFHLTPRTQPSDPQSPEQVTGPGPGGSPPPPRRFQCRLDESDWGACDSPRRLDGLSPGGHDFVVRGLSPSGRPGPATHFAWEQLEPKPFSVEPQTGTLADLYPGDPAQELPVRIANPNPAPIVVTGLTVAVATAPLGCPADPNFALTPASVSPAAPLTVPAGGSAGLPSAGASAPTIALRDLPVNQNACKGAEVRLAFSGEAHG